MMRARVRFVTFLVLQGTRALRSPPKCAKPRSTPDTTPPQPLVVDCDGHRLDDASNQNDDDPMREEEIATKLRWLDRSADYWQTGDDDPTAPDPRATATKKKDQHDDSGGPELTLASPVESLTFSESLLLLDATKTVLRQLEEEVAPTPEPVSEPEPDPTPEPVPDPTPAPVPDPTPAPVPDPTPAPVPPPTLAPVASPTPSPTTSPVVSPTFSPTLSPTVTPVAPTVSPTLSPTLIPTLAPVASTVSPTLFPTLKPIADPTLVPTVKPIAEPTSVPTSKPIAEPTSVPTVKPVAEPTSVPTLKPLAEPTSVPTLKPLAEPTSVPTLKPLAEPTSVPTLKPLAEPTSVPTLKPLAEPTSVPTLKPLAEPTSVPTLKPLAEPTSVPTLKPLAEPTSVPTLKPLAEPTSVPTLKPLAEPTSVPSTVPITDPTALPSIIPVTDPTVLPSTLPITEPTALPSIIPIIDPTSVPSSVPVTEPTVLPSMEPITDPTALPSVIPINDPTALPTTVPIANPTTLPSIVPVSGPSALPSTVPAAGPSALPTSVPVSGPTVVPSSIPESGPTSLPSALPVSGPTVLPTTLPISGPTSFPSAVPIFGPTLLPSAIPISGPTTCPSAIPISGPTSSPSTEPISGPTSLPSSLPSAETIPTLTPLPSIVPFTVPTSLPSVQPISGPTSLPSELPTAEPIPTLSPQPSEVPAVCPTSLPSVQPISGPTSLPSELPTAEPIPTLSPQPSEVPAVCPTSLPSVQPISGPTSLPSELPTAEPIPTLSPLPSEVPAICPTSLPSVQPISGPTSLPSELPTVEPIPTLSPQPSEVPAICPTSQPSVEPSTGPIADPTSLPTTEPIPTLTPQPSEVPAICPTSLPSVEPSTKPFADPTSLPTEEPIPTLTPQPSGVPAVSPTTQPSTVPLTCPTSTSQPTGPSMILQSVRTASPTVSLVPTTETPPPSNSLAPTSRPSTLQPKGLIPTPAPTPHDAPSAAPSVSISPAATRPPVPAISAAVPSTKPLPASSARPTTSQAPSNPVMELIGGGIILSGINETEVENNENVVATAIASTADVNASAISIAVSTNSSRRRRLEDINTVVIDYIVVTLATRTDEVLAALTNMTPALFDSALEEAAIAVGSSTDFTNVTTIVMTDPFLIVSLAPTMTPSTSHPSTPRPSHAPTPSPSNSPTHVPSSLPTPVPTLTPCDKIVGLPLPPLLSEATFTSTGARLLVDFNRMTDKAGRDANDIFDCDELLTFDGADDASCFWVNATQVDAVVSEAVDFYPGSEISLVANTTKAFCQDGYRCECYEFANRSTVNAVASTTVVPVVVFQGPTSISVCEDLTVSAEQTTGSGGREMTFIWEVLLDITAINASIADTAQMLLSLVESAEDNAVFSASSDQLSELVESGSKLELVLNATNFFGVTSSSAFEVSLVVKTIPFIEIVGGTQFTLTRSEELEVVVEAYGTDCESRPAADRQIEMEWTLFRLSGITFIETPLRSVSKNALRYRLNSYALESDTAYVLQAVAIDTIGDQQLNNSALALLNVVEGDVIAQITGGSTRRASVEDVIILSAAESYDDDVDVAAGEDAGLAYEWNCSNLGDGGSDCGIIYNGFTEAILEIEPATLAAGTYTFWVEVTANDGRRNATASQVLELSAAATPVVEITSFVTSVRAASKLTIEAEIASASTATEATTVTSSWDLVEGDLAQGRSLEDVVRTSLSITRVLSLSGVYTHDIVLGESSLVAGGRYVFQLDASSAGFESAGSATIEVNVVSPPSSGVLQVSPQSGIAFFDVFEFHALRWVGDELPLKYRFETENDVILRKSSLDNALTDARLPVPNDPPNMEVTVFVTDAVEASASTFVEVLVYANSTEGLVIATLDALEVAFANYSLDSVCQVVSASASTAEDNAELLDTLVVALNQSFELFGDDDREISEQIIAALLAPTADPPLLFFDTAFDALEVAKTVTSILVQVGLGVTESTAPDVVATVLSNLLESSLFENATANTTTNATGRSSLDATNTLLETIDAIALAQRNTLVENEDGESFNSKNVRGASRLFSSALGDTMQTVESATMNASANVTTVDGVVYEAFVAEFEVNPRGDGTGEVARSQVVRFNFNTSSTSSNSNNASGGGEETVVDLTIPGSEWLGRETNESRSLNVSAECECGFVGVKNVTCPDGLSHALVCDGTPGTHLFTCNSSRHLCATWDTIQSRWYVPSYCTPHAQRDGSTICRCSIENSGKSRGAEYSTLAEIKDISERYTPAFLTSPKIDESALVLIALGVLIGVVIFAHFFGQYLDRRARGGSLPMMQSNPWHRIRSFPRRMQSPPFLPTRHPRSVSSPQTTAMVRIKRIMTRRHPIINFLFEYNPEIPRSVRAWKFGLEIGIFFVAMGLENILENPNVNCESRKTHRECRQPKSLGTRRRLCSWNECSLPACYEDEAGNQAANSTEHFIVLMIVMVVLLPFLALLDFLFEHYLLAPCPPRLRYWCNFFFPVEGSNGDAGATTDFQQAAEDERRREERRRQAERDGDEIYYAGALDGDERYRDDSKRDDDPVDAVAVQHSATSSILDENTVLVYPGEPEDEDKASPRIAREVSDGVQEDKDSRDVIVDAAAAAADDEANQIQTRPRGDSEEVDVEVNYMPRKRDARKARGADPVALRQAQMMDGVTPYARMTRQITRRLPSNRSALWVSDLPTLVTEIVSRLRVVDDDEDVPEPSSREIGSWWLLSVSGVQDAISAGVRSLGSSRRSASRGQQQVQQESQQRQGEQQARGFFLFASAKRSRGLRKNRRIQIQTLAMHVQQAILRRQTELRTCMAEARRLPDARISARAILILRRLEVGMLRRWRWVPSKNLWLANIHVRIERHIDEAFRLKDELEEIRGFDHETTRDLREEKLLEAEKNSKLSLTEKKIYERTMTRALWQKSPPTEPPRLACYLLAWFVIALLVAGIVVLSMQVATNIGKGQSKLWLIGLTTAIFLFYCVILPSEILWFDYVLPSLLSEKIRQLADPTKLRRFPFKTKLPDSPTFYLVIMAPHLYSDTEIGKYVIEGSVGATTDTTTTEFYENELEVIHRDSTWRARLGTQLGLFISAWLRAWLVRVPDAFHELFFEELLITAVIFSKVLGNLPSWVGNSEGDNGEVLAMAVVILVFFAIVVVMTLMYTLCNCFERLVLRGEMREPRIDVA